MHQWQAYKSAELGEATFSGPEDALLAPDALAELFLDPLGPVLSGPREQLLGRFVGQSLVASREGGGGAALARVLWTVDVPKST